MPGPWASCSASPGPRPSVCPAAPLTFPLVWEKQRERVAWVTERRGPAGPAGAGPGCPSRSGEDGGGAVLPARGGSRGGLGAQRLLGVTHRAERGADGTGGASPRRAAAPGLAGAQQCRLQTSFFLLQERYTLAVQTPQVGAPSLVPPPEPGGANGRLSLASWASPACAPASMVRGANVLGDTKASRTPLRRAWAVGEGRLSNPSCSRPCCPQGRCRVLHGVRSPRRATSPHTPQSPCHRKSVFMQKVHPSAPGARGRRGPRVWGAGGRWPGGCGDRAEGASVPSGVAGLPQFEATLWGRWGTLAGPGQAGELRRGEEPGPEGRRRRWAGASWRSGHRAVPEDLWEGGAGDRRGLRLSPGPGAHAGWLLREELGCRGPGVQRCLEGMQPRAGVPPGLRVRVHVCACAHTRVPDGAPSRSAP